MLPAKRPLPCNSVLLHPHPVPFQFITADTMPYPKWGYLALALAFIVAACTEAPAQTRPTAHSTQNVFLITLDGLRWQELFTGADPILIGDERYVEDPADLKERFWRDDPISRRRALLPFFWNIIAKEGQIHGNRPLGSKVNVTNHHRFSYPGYNEILTGYADDDRIDSNDKRNNPNVTVLEFVNRQPGFAGRVAAFGSWDVFPFIINEARSGVSVNAGFRTASGDDLTDRERFLNELQPEIPSPWATVRLDAFTHHYAFEYLKKRRPQLLYIAYGETDDFAHNGRYDAYLTAAHRTDAFIEALWKWAQSNDDYRGKTTLLITTDHGRGKGDAWTDHGADVDGADAIWIAALGPDTPPDGEVTAEGPYFQNQIAATVAVLLGLEYTSEHPFGPALSRVTEH